MKKLFLFSAGIFLMAGLTLALSSEQSKSSVLYENGPLVTVPGGGFGGADICELQKSLSMDTYGFNNDFTSTFRIADDFIVPPGEIWTIDSITLYGYQTDSGTTSPLNGAYFQIWNGSPESVSSQVIWGNLTTNRMSSTGWTGIYRVSDTSVNDTKRPIMYIQSDVDITLTAGTYWIDWTINGAGSSGPWQPPITILGKTTTGNAIRNTAGNWFPAMDDGTYTPQGCPFLIEGTKDVDLPSIDIQPTSFSVNVPIHQTHGETMTILNNGTAKLNYGIHVATQKGRDIGGWTDVTPVATEVQWPAGCFGDGRFFVIGGLVDNDTGELFNGIQIYNSSLGAWSTSAPMLTPVFSAVAVYHNRNVYVVGGYSSSAFESTDKVQIYDVANDSWSLGAPMPSPRGGASGGLINGKIYSLGGASSSSFPTENVAYEYNIVGNTWRTLTDGPIKNYGITLGGGCAYKGKIYIGGHYFSENYQFYEFDPTGGGTWTSKATFPNGLGGLTPSLIPLEDEGIILGVGGGYDWEATGATWSYRPDTDIWADLSKPMTTAVIGGAAGAGNGQIYFYGGTVGSGAVTPAPFMKNTYTYDTWLTVNPQSGTVLPGSSEDINLHFDADGAGGVGVYNAMLVVFNNDPSANPWDVPVTMNVTDKCDYLGTRLVISQKDLFRAEDEFWLECHVCNNSVDPMNDIATAVLLGVYGEFWFYPSWNAQQEFDVEYRDYKPGLTIFWAIEPFIWPEVGGHAIGLEFYSGLLNAQMDDLIGEFGHLTFGYTDL